MGPLVAIPGLLELFFPQSLIDMLPSWSVSARKARFPFE
jgi:hypothetical protein